MGILILRNTTIPLTGLLFFNLTFSFCVYSFKQPTVTANRKDSLRVKNVTTSTEHQQDLNEYLHHTSAYFTDFNLDYVWKSYLHVDPYELWSGPVNRLKLIYNRKDHFDVKKVGECTAILLELNFLKKIKLDALFIITKIDPIAHLIEFCYAKNNITHGLQRITFEQSKNGTVIEHETYYQSNNPFRDHMLYPYFHQKCIDEFHERLNIIMLKNKVAEYTSFDNTITRL
ncbi:MAG: hypothetical protein WDZ35_11335 [Crocinitomicaceae bacterium]